MNIAVFGACGRVGSKVVQLAQKRGHIVVPIDIKNKDKSNDPTDIFRHSVNVTVRSGDSQCNDDCCSCVANESKTVEPNPIDAVIDFSTAEATNEVCEYCVAHHCALISGVTGRNDEQQRLIDELSALLPVICKSNFSVGIDMLHKICQAVASELPDWDCEIVETHRRGKKDAPSGTAKSLATAVAKQKNFKSVTTHALRLGSNCGRHEVIFATNGESLTLVHQAENVDIFALGAVIECEKLAK